MAVSHKYAVKLGIAAWMVLGWHHAAMAEFALNFTGTTITNVIHGGTSIGGQTPFLTSSAGAQAVTDPTTGLSYYHLIIGDPATGFAQEVYIQRGFAPGWQNGSNSASGGSGGGGGGNGRDPFDVDPAIVTATGGGNPQRVQMRLIINDGEMNQEFIKGTFANKPKITQNLNGSAITAQFEFDMSAINYTDMNTPGTMINRVTVNDPGVPGSSAQFDAVADAQVSTITGGRYTYTPGGGPGGSAGTYSYFDGDFDHTQQDWVNIFDQGDASNVWAYPGNKP